MGLVCWEGRQRVAVVECVLGENRLEASELAIRASLGNLRITHERGLLVHYIREQLEGEEGAWEALLARVSEPCRRLFERPVGAYEWVDASLAVELSRAYYGECAEAITYQRGRDAAEHQITRVNQWILKFLSPSFLIANLPRIFRFYVREGHVTVPHREPGVAVVEVWALGLYPEYWQFGLRGWFEVALGLTGCRCVQVEYTPLETHEGQVYHHRYTVRWE